MFLLIYLELISKRLIIFIFLLIFTQTIKAAPFINGYKNISMVICYYTIKKIEVIKSYLTSNLIIFFNLKRVFIISPFFFNI